MVLVRAEAYKKFSLSVKVLITFLSNCLVHIKVEIPIIFQTPKHIWFHNIDMKNIKQSHVRSLNHQIFGTLLQ